MTEVRKGRPLKAHAVPQPRPADVVPPPQYDRMRAPVWIATLAAPSRAGALNHQRIESRGFRC